MILFLKAFLRVCVRVFSRGHKSRSSPTSFSCLRGSIGHGPAAWKTPTARLPPPLQSVKIRILNKQAREDE
ncbi:hypothetical protein TRSC58_07320 [Trypanosoma rangeli SC58]|uniref:Uncharacterized protein n=1 Tax=Trypanosoma rangeli SC58 TaxID=429131 RepID=A0A061IT44_TRYRA|nr:hypothetical protein TRSC58_07320 [Trypanosoma rangeli SC58]